MFSASKRTWMVVCVLTALVGAARAAPTDEVASDRPTASFGDAAGAKPAERVVTPEISSGSRTVDMLIELQGKPAGLGPAVTERTSARTDLPTPKTDAAINGFSALAPPPDKAGLFGSAANPVAATRYEPAAATKPPPEWPSASAERSLAGTASPGTTPQAHQSELDGGGERLRVLRTVVNWIRENRTLVIGAAVLLLAAVGFASARAGQRRR